MWGLLVDSLMLMLTELWCSGPLWSVLMGLSHILAVCLGFTHAGKGKSFNMSHVRLSLQTGDESLMLLRAWGLSTWSCSPWSMGAPWPDIAPCCFLLHLISALLETQGRRVSADNCSFSLLQGECSPGSHVPLTQRECLGLLTSGSFH